MANPEIAHPEDDVLPTLVIPYPGVYREIVKEYEEDPRKFKTLLQLKVDVENPQLVQFFSRNTELPHPGMSLRWVSTYYEMFSRSAARTGKPMVEVSNYNYLYIVRLFAHYFMQYDEGSEAKRMEIRQIQDEKRNMRIKRDEGISEELRIFWSEVQREIAINFTEGVEDDEIRSDLVPLDLIQNLLQKQEDDNKLELAYSA